MTELRFRFLTLLALAAALIALGFVSSGTAATGGGNGGQGPRAVSILGVAQVQGQDVIVDVLVAVQPGEDAREAALAGLESQGARPLDSASLGSEGFTVLGLVWDSLPIVQNYNPSNEPSTVVDAGVDAGWKALKRSQKSWNDVSTSTFAFDILAGETTERCPSLVRECRGKQFFDGINDVGWLRLSGILVLGVTWYATEPPYEADMALNNRTHWFTDGIKDFDVETVFLHENGHVVGLGHSDISGAVLEPFYSGVRQTLHQDDEEGATYLYDKAVTGSVSGTVTTDGTSATVVLEGTGLSATTAGNGTYTISGVPDPVTYTVTASAGGFDSATTLRLTVDGGTANIDFTLTLASDENGGGGPPPCQGKNKNDSGC